VLKLFAFTFAARCINLLLLCTKVHKSAQRCFNDAKDKKSKAEMEIKTKTTGANREEAQNPDPGTENADPRRY